MMAQAPYVLLHFFPDTLGKGRCDPVIRAGEHKILPDQKAHLITKNELSRKNISFDMPSRIIKINRINILSVDKNIVTAEIDCGKGTYIRTLAEDIGKAFNIPTTLKNLCRVRVGNFNLDNSATIEDLKIAPEKFCVPVEDCLNFRKFFLLEHRLKAFRNGLSTTVRADDELVKVYCGEKFLGVGKILNNELYAAKLIDTEI